MKKRKVILLCIVCLLADTGLFAQKVNFEFINQKLSDILYAVSVYRGVSIVPDDTVTGTANFQFAGTDFDKAFDSFLANNRLYANRKENVWTISKILIGSTEDTGIISLDALDAEPAQILERISRYTGKTILFDMLPSSKISLHIAAENPEEITALVMKPFTTFTVENTPTHILVKKNTGAPLSAAVLSRMNISHEGNTYTAEINQAKYSEVIEKICREEKIEYSSFIKNDPVLSGINIRDKNFDELMEIILEQSGAEKIEKNGILYILPSATQDFAKKIRDLNLTWKAFEIKKLRSKEALTLIAARFPGAACIPIPGTTTFIIQVSETSEKEIHDYLGMIDTADYARIVKLKYISTADLIKTLPPSIRKEEITDTGTGKSVFFSGPEEMRERFLEELKEIDRPKERIRYDMLIIQYEKSTNLNWQFNTEIKPLSPGDMTSVSGSFGNLLNLNFDVITLFGYDFSAKLNTAISQNSAHVFADTTLHGITGEGVKFQNTSTYRYRDSNIDPETGKAIYTGVTREIVSGVILDINGWVSGEGMVTMNIQATVSKRGVDVSGKSGNPPPTSEKSITTKLNTSNGEPVILSGLTQNDSSIVEQRVPFLSRIPLVGWLFKSRTNSDEKTEMVIYIVPHITNGYEKETRSDVLASSAIDRLVRPFIKDSPL